MMLAEQPRLLLVAGPNGASKLRAVSVDVATVREAMSSVEKAA